MVLLPEPDHAGGTKKEKQKNNGSQYYGDSRSNVSGKIIHKWKKERPVEAALIIKGITNNYSALSHHTGSLQMAPFSNSRARGLDAATLSLL